VLSRVSIGCKLLSGQLKCGVTWGPTVISQGVGRDSMYGIMSRDLPRLARVDKGRLSKGLRGGKGGTNTVAKTGQD